ncbi:hypothetical protein DdX_20402 [Ditylenchus destructor]|uniref:Uncharacterized protein n=1 Tax=Ditylenchus destructor TaxID=166010 RepID=A0AAD4MLH0_9BILA|nr:hypothetical protein DdX_20402 [Ditylenchus destructor]
MVDPFRRLHPNNASSYNDSIISHNAPLLVGFTGIGTLGGGNLTVSAGGDAGTLTDFSTPLGDTASGGSPGGGDMTIRIGGALKPDDPGADLRHRPGRHADQFARRYRRPPRALDRLDHTCPGRHEGDPRHARQAHLVGRRRPRLGRPDDRGGYQPGHDRCRRRRVGDRRAVRAQQLHAVAGRYCDPPLFGRRDNHAGDAGGVERGAARPALLYPAILTATAPGGNIDWSGAFCGNDCNTGIPALVLSPSPKGQVEFLAGHTITGMAQFSQEGVGDYVTSMPVAMSGMSNSRDLLPNIFRPVWGGMAQRTPDAPVPTVTGNGSVGSAVAFQSETASGRLIEGRKKPALFYAVEGDVREFSFGMTNWSLLSPIYISSGSATIRAGRDIVNLGSPLALGCGISGPVDCRGVGQIYGGPFLTSGLVVHNDPRDITLISAGRDVVFAT